MFPTFEEFKKKANRIKDGKDYAQTMWQDWTSIGTQQEAWGDYTWDSIREDEQQYFEVASLEELYEDARNGWEELVIRDMRAQVPIDIVLKYIDKKAKRDYKFIQEDKVLRGI